MICYDAISEAWKNETPHYIGVDSTYFQCTMIPNRPSGDSEQWVSRLFPIRVGKKVGNWSLLTNNSFRLISMEKELAAAPESDAANNATDNAADNAANILRHEYTIFAGPKNPAVLSLYGLEGTLSYGWFAWIVYPMLGILHVFHGLGFGYGMAIILLTILVRLLIFPLSKKQAKSAIKMQQLAPEVAVLKERYKDDAQAFMKAQQELWKKHKFHPASGCLGLFIQLPIFVALYKALSIDVELYGVSLVSPAFRWCNDLSGPDMLFYWGNFWNSLGWSGFNTGQGMFYLGPYFNLLPMLTIVLFLIQQWVMMPPPTDEQSRMQRTMMNIMMPMMGLLFFKMPSGLCVYFIVSTLWGLGERQFIPKAPKPAEGETIDTTFVDTKTEKKLEKKERPSRSVSPEPPKEEGFFKKMWREVNEKASEQRKLEKAKEKTRDRRKKK
ncbi:MAG TPA: hypothetical protein DEB39_02270 [Planctomycetaceae bacterium]|nr:hypothetical protein [Planctomycetaceae bacterium]